VTLNTKEGSGFLSEKAGEVELGAEPSEIMQKKPCSVMLLKANLKVLCEQGEPGDEHHALMKRPVLLRGCYKLVTSPYRTL